tara:strand:+ start:132 stop:461 length:330 start_codon:yes stop_codon:yes gene_type:complete
MQKTKFREFLNSLLLNLNTFVYDSWTKRSILILSLFSGFYFTNSLISFLLDKSVNTLFLALSVLLITEIVIRSLLLSQLSKLSLIIIAINNFRIGSTYALILEAFKLGS